jgi:cell division protein FtsB
MKRLGWLIFALLVLYFIFLIRQDIIDYFDLKREEKHILKNLKKEEIINQRLQKGLQKAQSDKQLEKLARTRLLMIKKGETAYKVISN